jgi:hypothetical protein
MPTLKPFYDIAGSSFLTLPTGLDFATLEQVLRESKMDILGRSSKIKVIFDDYGIDNVQEILERVFVECEIGPYNSHFFKIGRNNIEQFLNQNSQLDWSAYQANFVNLEDLGETEKSIIKDLLINSFAVKIVKENDQEITAFKQEKIDYINTYFEADIDNPNMLTFLVQDKMAQIVGCYSLTKVGNEAQLSAVAGRTSLPNGYRGGKKLPILSASMIYEFSTSPFFEGCEFLTLSNSKTPVANFYHSLGIPDNRNRKGLSVEKI